MTDQLLARDVMRIGVPTCKPAEPIAALAARMAEHGWTAVVVLDDDGDARGWINERMLAQGYVRQQMLAPGAGPVTAAEIMEERVPDAAADLPLTAIVQLMSDLGVDHMFFMHHAGGRSWPASMLSLQDVVRALAGPDFIRHQGMHAQRPTPLDLFRQRYGLPGKR